MYLMFITITVPNNIIYFFSKAVKNLHYNNMSDNKKRNLFINYLVGFSV